MSKFPLLITSVLNAYATSSNMIFSFDLRKLQTLNALESIVELNIFKWIVIVDGSNNKLLSQDDISQYAKRGVIIEQICFQQDIESVIKYGKSNGEVQIVNFAIDNSKIINEFQEFYKISGRYIIRNIRKIITQIDCYENVFYFDNPFFYNRDKQFVTTYFYKTSLNFYKTYLYNLQNETSVEKDGYLESVYFRAIEKRREKSIKSDFPFVLAISGTTGKIAINRWYILRNIFSRTGFLSYSFK